MSWVKAVLFLDAVLLLWGFIHWYVYRRLLSLFSGKGILPLIFFLLFASFPLTKILARVLPPSLSFPLYFLACLWMGLLFYLFLYLLLGNLLEIFLGGSVYIRAGAVALALLTVFYGLFEAGSVAVRNLELEVPSPSGGEVRIVHLSDLHLGLNLNYLRLKRVLGRINGFSPDLILITGDLLDQEVERAGEYRELLLGLKAKIGVFAVSGNHEFYAGEERAFKIIKSWGIRLLRNRVLDLGKVVLAGVDDEEFLGRRWRENLREVLKRAEGSKPVILLKHRPTGFSLAGKMGVSLMLCGHTHRGQLFPLHLLTARVYRYFYGYHREGKMQIYVNAGLGTWGPPIRVLSRPEVVFITLKLKREKP